MLLFFKFGWGKPVPIDPYNLTRREEIFVALSGPLSNFLLALLFSLLFRFFPMAITLQFIAINISLAVFNLLPIPPLDGSKIFLNLLSEEKSIEWEKTFDQYGFLLLALLLFLPVAGSNIVSLLISPVINFILHLMLGIS
jgi:Zn-dependent protease